MKFTAEILIQPFRNSKRAFPDCAFFSPQLGKHFKLEIECLIEFWFHLTKHVFFPLWGTEASSFCNWHFEDFSVSSNVGLVDTCDFRWPLTRDLESFGRHLDFTLGLFPHLWNEADECVSSLLFTAEIQISVIWDSSSKAVRNVWLCQQ